MMQLYTYWRSTAAYRVRVALNLKGIDYAPLTVDLVKNGGEQHSDAFKQINPQGLVPALVTENGSVISQSMAIMEYLQETHPLKPILPEDSLEKAHCRALAQTIVSDIHPLNNLRVLQYLKQSWEQSAVDAWYKHWINKGFSAIETVLKDRKHTYMSAEYPCISDICLMGQLYNARRFSVPLEDYPLILEIENRCSELDAFQQAHPNQQADAKS